MKFRSLRLLAVQRRGTAHTETRRRILCVVCVCVHICLNLSFASVVVSAEKTKPVDQQLFQALEEDLFSDLAPIGHVDSKQPEEQKSSQLDIELQHELGGEDLGQQQGANPLEKIAGRMRQVRDRLAAKNAAVETQQLQARIVEEFDDLIARLKRQKQQQSESSAQSPQSKPGGQQQAGSKPGQAQPNAQSNAPAPDSTARLGQAEPTAATPAEQALLMQRAWGNLPAAQQREMQSARPEKFLPKYSRLIEDYFKRLAEDLER